MLHGKAPREAEKPEPFRHRIAIDSDLIDVGNRLREMGYSVTEVQIGLSQDNIHEFLIDGEFRVYVTRQHGERSAPCRLQSWAPNDFYRVIWVQANWDSTHLAKVIHRILAFNTCLGHP